MLYKLMPITALALLAGATACSFAARGPELYRDDTQKLLATRNAQLKSCYDQALKVDSNMTGTVTVHFVVAEETGKITNPVVDPTGSNAPEALGQCVVRSLDGLALDPPDQNQGQATFVYEFKPNPVPPPAAPPPAGAGAVPTPAGAGALPPPAGATGPKL